jgi:DnaJ like chaperone protein
MSIWGKVVGGVAGFALGGPLGAILGAGMGHAVDRTTTRRTGPGPASLHARQSAFTVAVVVLGAKMAKADGKVTPDEIAAFKKVFHIPAGEMKDVARLFNEARKEAQGFEPYAAQVGQMFAHDPAVLEELLAGLFYIANADGVMHPNELEFLGKVAKEFGFDTTRFERVRASCLGPDLADPYEVLGQSRSASDADLKAAYRNLIRENHPDTLIAKGVPEEMIEIATEKMANINDAYDRIRKERSLP